MGFGAGLVLVAVGAVLRWGVTDNIEDLNLATIGLILIVVGVIGLIASLMFWSSWGGFGSSRRSRTQTSDGRVYEETVETR